MTVDHTIAARDVLSGAVYTTTPAVKAMAQDYLDLVEAADHLLETVDSLLETAKALNLVQ